MLQVFRFIKANKVLVALVAIFAVHQLTMPMAESTTISKYVTLAVNLSLLVPIVYLIVFGKTYDHRKAFVSTSLYSVPVLALAVCLLFILRPKTADWLAREDFIVENLTALAAVGGSIILVGVGIYLVRNKQFLQAAFALLISLAFFVVSMERYHGDNEY